MTTGICMCEWESGREGKGRVWSQKVVAVLQADLRGWVP